MQRIAFQFVSGSCLCVLACVTLAGCRLPHRAAAPENEFANYEQATISYDVADRCGALLSADNPITPAAYRSEDTTPGDESSPLSDSIWKSAQLSIQYPHPDAVPDMAQVTLRLSCQSVDADDDAAAAPRCRSLCNDELWVLDIRKGELDRLLMELSGDGFFDEAEPSAQGARLAVAINDNKIAKPWNREPQLDQLVQQVYQQGRLRGFVPSQQACERQQTASPRFPALTQRSLEFGQKL